MCVYVCVRAYAYACACECVCVCIHVLLNNLSHDGMDGQHQWLLPEFMGVDIVLYTLKRDVRIKLQITQNLRQLTRTELY